MKELRNILIWLACNALIFCSGPANAQEEKNSLIGECVRHTAEQGPWDCKLKSFAEPSCRTGTLRRLDKFWYEIRDAAETSAHAKHIFSTLHVRDAIDFFACQGLHLVVHSIPGDRRFSAPLDNITIIVFGEKDLRLKEQAASWKNAIGCSNVIEQLVGLCSNPTSFRIDVRFDKFGAMSKVVYGGSVK